MTLQNAWSWWKFALHSTFSAFLPTAWLQYWKHCLTVAYIVFFNLLQLITAWVTTIATQLLKTNEHHRDNLVFDLTCDIEISHTWLNHQHISSFTNITLLTSQTSGSNVSKQSSNLRHIWSTDEMSHIQNGRLYLYIIHAIFTSKCPLISEKMQFLQWWWFGVVTEPVTPMKLLYTGPG